MLTTGFIMLIGVLFDVVVWYYSKGLVIFENKEKKIEEKGFDKVIITKINPLSKSFEKLSYIF